MKFDDVTGNGKLWAVKYDNDEANVLSMLFRQWTDLDWLTDFFVRHKADLVQNFHITNVDKAIYDTLDDAQELECLILDLAFDSDLDMIFRPLENYRAVEMVLGREKAKGNKCKGHSSWLRLYALRFDKDSYLITGGAIKLTRAMQDRTHTLNELAKMELVRNYLISQGVTDLEGFNDFIKGN